VSGDVPGISEGRFTELAEAAEEHCPMARALFGNVNLHVDARLSPQRAFR
jgi:organic hydroperoxide reductase OsmC/OhrA